MYTRLVALISVVLIRTYGDLDASCGVGKGNGMGDHVRNVLSISWRRAAWEGAYPVRVTSATLTSHLTNSGGEFDVSCRDIGTRHGELPEPITPLPVKLIIHTHHPEPTKAISIPYRLKYKQRPPTKSVCMMQCCVSLTTLESTKKNGSEEDVGGLNTQKKGQG